MATATYSNLRGRTAAKRGTRAYLNQYLKLCRVLPLAPIASRAELARAVRMIDALSIIGEDELSPAQADYLEVLGDLVQEYEARHHPLARSSDPVDVLTFLLEEHGMTASDLGRLLGNRSLGSKILRRERGLSQRHVRVLAEYFRVNPALFLR